VTLNVAAILPRVPESCFWEITDACNLRCLHCEADAGRAAPDELTTDLMEMGNWCEVAWLKLGDEVVSAGGHRLQIRLSKAKDSKGKWLRVLYASDAICLQEGPFPPNSKFKPGESGRDAADEAAGKVVLQPAEL